MQDNYTIKKLPHSVEAEQSVIGGLMISHKSWWKICELVKAEDFFRADHRLIFAAIAGLLEKHTMADVVTLSERLDARGELGQAGGMGYLGQLASDTPSAANISAYAKIVRDMSIRRDLIVRAQEVSEIAYSDLDSPVNDVVDSAQALFMDINQQQQGEAPVEFNTTLNDLVDELQRRFEMGGAITGIATGFKKLDEMTCGLQPGELTVLAARPSMGKTTLAGNIIENIGIKDSKPVLFFSLEMTAVSIAERILSSLSDLHHKKIKTADFKQEEWAKVTSFISRASNSGLHIDESPKLSINQIRARSRIHKQKHGLGLIVVDYLTEMAEQKAHNRRDAVGANIKGLKALAKELNVPVLCLAQLNREVGSRNDRRPQLTDLGVSGDIEQTADIVMMLHRESYYDVNFPHPEISELIFRKNRNGEQGTICLESDLSHLRFIDSNFDMDRFLYEQGQMQQENPKKRSFSI